MCVRVRACVYVCVFMLGMYVHARCVCLCVPVCAAGCARLPFSLCACVCVCVFERRGGLVMHDMFASLLWSRVNSNKSGVLPGLLTNCNVRRINFHVTRR